MRVPSHPVFESLRKLATEGPIVVAHRGCSRDLPENTVPAFAAAHALGVRMQEFDVRVSRDGALVCMHDEGLDRTTDAARRLGPGALVAQTTLAELQQLDAGTWHPSFRRPAAVPTLAEALATMLPSAVPLIEHKAGDAGAYVAELQRLGALQRCILQSFDWAFVTAVRQQAPGLAVAALGPNAEFPRPEAEAIAAAIECGAGMLHWHAAELTTTDVARIHAAGLLLCTYTTDDDPRLIGGALMGFDAMCTNVPHNALALQSAGWLRRL